MLALLRSEQFKLSHRLMTRVLLLIMFAAPLGAYVLLGATGDPEDSDVLDDMRIGVVYDNARFIVFQIGVIAAIVLSASTIASEFTSGTIRTVLPRSAGRSPFVMAKMVTLCLIVATVVVLGFIAALAGSVLVTTLKDLDSSTGDNFVGQLLGSVVKTGFAILPYTSMAFLIALLSRSSAAGIAIPIVAFYTEVLLTPVLQSVDAIEWLPQALIYSANISALLDSDAVISSADLPDVWQATAVLAAYVGAFFSLAYWRFLTRDIT